MDAEYVTIRVDCVTVPLLMCDDDAILIIDCVLIKGGSNGVLGFCN